MPIYEYECLKCGEMHEALRKFSDKPLSKCPKCSGTLKSLSQIHHSSSKAQAGIRQIMRQSHPIQRKNLMQRKTQALNQKQKPRLKLKQRAKTESKADAAVKA